MPDAWQYWIVFGVLTVLFVGAVLILTWLYSPVEYRRVKPRGRLARVGWQLERALGRVILCWWRREERRKRRDRDD